MGFTGSEMGTVVSSYEHGLHKRKNFLDERFLAPEDGLSFMGIVLLV
jgi:hypothetical protein